MKELLKKYPESCDGEFPQVYGQIGNTALPRTATPPFLYNELIKALLKSIQSIKESYNINRKCPLCRGLFACRFGSNVAARRALRRPCIVLL